VTRSPAARPTALSGDGERRERAKKAPDRAKFREVRIS